MPPFLQPTTILHCVHHIPTPIEKKMRKRAYLRTRKSNSRTKIKKTLDYIIPNLQEEGKLNL